MSKETRQFQTETKQLLDLMINSIYTHKEIFLRELISNGSDALDKVKFQSLTNPEILEDNGDLELVIDGNTEAKTVTIRDNGIGMSYDDVVENIGTIAKSGTKSFVQKVTDSKESEDDSDQKSAELELIGQFGVGFYAAFMVADSVTLTTRKAGEKEGVRWTSKGDGSYEIETIPVEKRGTEIVLSLRENSDSDTDYTNEHVLKGLVKKYSDFISYPIRMDVEKTEYPKDEDGKYIEGGEPIKSREIETINSMKPLWMRNKREIEEREYADFYKQVFHDWEDPLEIIHSKAEGTLEYTTLLYIPRQAPFDLYQNNFKKGVKLYSKNVFIMDNCEELLPDHFKFVRGLVDSSDFSLNISRELLQQDLQLKVIKKNIEKKIYDTLKYMAENEYDNYMIFWKAFGKLIKSGIYSDYSAKDKLKDLLVFNSSADAEKMTSLKEYVSRMKEGQDAIYYATGEDRSILENLPQMEILKDKGYEVIYFLDKVDEFITQNLEEFDGKKLKSISRGDLFEEDDATKEAKKEREEESKPLLEAIKSALESKVSGVQLSSRLKNSAVCLVSSKDGISLNMEKVLKQYDNVAPKADRILEINPDHKLYAVLEKVHTDSPESDRFKDCCTLLYDQALLIEGITPEDPVGFAHRVAQLMIDAN